MSRIDMKELYAPINEQYIKELQLYDNILKKCHSRILFNSKNKRTYCFYQIPEFMIGVPLYDVIKLKKYIINSLKSNGFELLYIDPNWLFITWNLKPNKKLSENTNVTKLKNDSKYISTETYKPTGKFIYGDSNMLNFADKITS